jgi:hypothetical protein
MQLVNTVLPRSMIRVIIFGSASSALIALLSLSMTSVPYPHGSFIFRLHNPALIRKTAITVVSRAVAQSFFSP